MSHSDSEPARGRIGIIGPSGTGTHELRVRLDDFHGDVATIITTPSSDLESPAGAARTLAALAELASDPLIEVIVVLGYAPFSSAAAGSIVDAARSSRKPVILCLVGADPDTASTAAIAGVDLHTRTKPAALAAAVASGVDPATLDLHPLNWPLIYDVRGRLASTQRDVRGYFTSRALCAEAMFLALEKLPQVAGNMRGASMATQAHEQPRGNVFLHLGSEAPHSPAGAGVAEQARLLRESADDPSVGVVVLDFVLGRGGDPVGELAPAISEAKAVAAEHGRHLEVLGYILGTDADTPPLAEQAAALCAAGATWASSATNTGLLAREFVTGA